MTLAYPSYRPSKVEWLGSLPEHWGVKRIKETSYLKARVGWKGLTSDEFMYSGFAYLVTGTDFRAKFIDWSDCYCVDRDRYDDDPFIQLESGDLLITKDGTIGKLAIVTDLEKPACLNSGIFVVRPIKAYTTSYLYWVLSSPNFTHFCDLGSFGSTIQHLYQNVFENFSFPIPPINEQTAIATFLDRETGKIDALIAEQKPLIELLKEKRQAVISRAVTKGLKPDAPMKASGVEWLGDVPEHWEIVPLRWFATCSSGAAIGTDQVHPAQDSDAPVPVIGGNGVMGFSSDANVDHEVLAIGRVGALCGNVHQILPPAWITDNALVLEANTRSFDLAFLAQLLRARNLNQLAARTAQPLITGTQVRDQRLPKPPLAEQAAIAGEIVTQVDKFEALQREAENAIALLTERRAALISAAVTGKIDVRTFEGRREAAASPAKPDRMVFA
ncbi:restriction endonuclease subunit S [Mesorhizobium sp. BH1-1-4]|uniref:restriction endonuclease subunit S n=1 Tax=Mesorhizobium sp. BH1-1-4 TaxID=2876662 RepID=UPI001CD105B8|nr:restriction endonuclease subunit S [Mesorhizobium sp. BH1-1-4]MBZ9996034.1 restriction endonuclease subunit S [Mesorhizobium sp. BH1-1-4]